MSVQNSENTDDRDPYDWKNRYIDDEAKRHIRNESLFLGTIFISIPFFAFLIWLDCHSKCYIFSKLQVSTVNCFVISKYIVGTLGGAFGGTLFDIKWLIHAVATGKWHLNRKLWRYFVPFTSGGFALAFISLISSGFIRIFDSHSLDSFSAVFGFGFLVGYFSDNAIAKLSEVAKTLFGNLEEKK